MSHNAYTAGRGGTVSDWPGDAAVTSAEFAWFAKGVFEAINGDQGGTWAPSSVITIGGAGVEFTTIETTFYGIVCTGNAGFNNVGISGVLNTSGNVGFSSSTSTPFPVGQYLAVTFYGTFDVYGGVTLRSDLEFVGTGTRTITVGADYASTFNGSTYLLGTTTLHDCNIPAGYSLLSDGEIRANAGIRQPIETHTTSGTITAGVRYVVCNLSAGGFVTLPTNHPINAPIKIINKANLAVTVRTPAGTRLFDVQDSSADTKWAEVYWDGSSWIDLVDNGIIP